MFRSVLVVEQALSAADVEFVTALHEGRRSFVVLIQPRGAQDRLLRLLDDVALGELRAAAHEGDTPEGDAARQFATAALERSLTALRAAGCEAAGRIVVDGHLLDAVRSAVEQVHADEVIVLTAPHLLEEFFHQDWASRARRMVEVPVLKLYAHR